MGDVMGCQGSLSCRGLKIRRTGIVKSTNMRYYKNAGRRPTSADRDESYWPARTSKAFSDMRNENMLKKGLMNASKISMKEVSGNYGADNRRPKG
eukprot:1160855-Pelagomonas_calceolata.AAC.6